MQHKHKGGIERSPAPRPAKSISIRKIVVRGKHNSKTYHVRIPHANRISYAHFPHEQTVHPPETKLHEFHTLLFQMIGQGRVNALRQIPQCSNLSVNSRLGVDIIVLDAVKQFCQSQERISFHRIQNTAR
jgi:hypothetical protein